MISRGEVWMADLGQPQGREFALLHPVVILQIDDLRHLNTVVVVPFTSKLNRSHGGATVLTQSGEGGLTLPSVALCHQIRVLDVNKLQKQLGNLPQERLYEIEAAVAFTLGLPF